MGTQKGMITTCERCPASVFSPLIGKEYFDGGYSSADKFEPLPDGWARTQVKGVYTYLCPACADLWYRLGQAFMERKPIENYGQLCGEVSE